MSITVTVSLQSSKPYTCLSVVIPSLGWIQSVIEMTLLLAWVLPMKVSDSTSVLAPLIFTIMVCPLNRALGKTHVEGEGERERGRERGRERERGKERGRERKKRERERERGGGRKCQICGHYSKLENFFMLSISKCVGWGIWNLPDCFSWAMELAKRWEHAVDYSPIRWWLLQLLPPRFSPVGWV